jgi:hypothetical protein
MEDITEEDGNYGEFPIACQNFYYLSLKRIDRFCFVCVAEAEAEAVLIIEINFDLSRYLVEYQVHPSMKWKPSQFERSVVQQVSHLD